MDELTTVNVLYVCLANRYRSPTAEIITRHIAEREGLNLNVSSAGLSPGGFLGLPRGIARALQDKGYDPYCHHQHFARRLIPDILNPQKIVFGFENDEIEYISGRFSNLEGKVVATLTGFVGHPEVQIRRIDNLIKKLTAKQYYELRFMPKEDRFKKYEELGKVDPRDRAARAYLHERLVDTIEMYVKMAIDKMVKDGLIFEKPAI